MFENIKDPYHASLLHVFLVTFGLFRLDQQSWTRQPTSLTRDLASFQRWFNTWSSRTMTFSAGSIFVAVLLMMV